MLGRMHADVARMVVLAATNDRKMADKVADLAAWPDDVDDIWVPGIGPHIVGLSLSSLTHFTVPKRGGGFRGYCWDDDYTTGVELPNVDLTVYVGDWVKFVGKPYCDKHPQRLALVKKGHNYADELTYVTSADMAEWLAGAKRNEATLACILHMVCDAGVYHHARGILLQGHSTHEATWQDWFYANKHGAVGGRFYDLAKGPHLPWAPRMAVEKLSVQARGNTKWADAGEMYRMLVLTVTACGRVMRWWMGEKP
jgi:hypothetical protein